MFVYLGTLFEAVKNAFMDAGLSGYALDGIALLLCMAYIGGLTACARTIFWYSHKAMLKVFGVSEEKHVERRSLPLLSEIEFTKLEKLKNNGEDEVLEPFVIK